LRKFDGDKKNSKEYNIKLLNIILKQLLSHKNTKMIQNIKKNIKQSENNLPILRSLLAEDKLIEANKKFIEIIINIIKSGKKNYLKILNNKNKKDIKSRVVKENKNYFNKLYTINLDN